MEKISAENTFDWEQLFITLSAAFVGAVVTLTVWFADKLWARIREKKREEKQKRVFENALRHALQDIRENAAQIRVTCQAKTAELKREVDRLLSDGFSQSECRQIARELDADLAYISPRMFEEMLSVEVWRIVPDRVGLSKLGALRADLGAIQARLKRFSATSSARFRGLLTPEPPDVDSAVQDWANELCGEVEAVVGIADRIASAVDHLLEEMDPPRSAG